MKHFQFGVLLPEHTSVYTFDDDGTFPNNEHLPVVVYQHALQISNPDLAEKDLNEVLQQHQWHHPWRGGIQDVHHYHSTAHEVLAVISGTVKLLIGGPSGATVNMSQGDVIIIPAGVAHKCEEASADFECVGAYPLDQLFDMNYGHVDERSRARENILQVPLPAADPIYGADGPLNFHWHLDVHHRV